MGFGMPVGDGIRQAAGEGLPHADRRRHSTARPRTASKALRYAIVATMNSRRNGNSVAPSLSAGNVRAMRAR